MRLQDTLSLSFQAIQSNRLRTSITVAIIAFGIMALVGINTAIEAMKQKFTDSFAAMGANGFTINYKNSNFFRSGIHKKKSKGIEKKSNLNKQISKKEAETFKRTYLYPSQVSLSLFGSKEAILSMGNKKTTPTVTVIGGDENYTELNAFDIVAGRNLNELDIESGRNVCIIGYDIVKRFFNSDPEIAIDKVMKVNNMPYRIIGSLDSKGTTIGRNLDNMVLTSYNNIRRLFNSRNASFKIGVKVSDVRMLSQAIGEAEGVFRPIRKIDSNAANNFDIDTSDKLVEQILTNLGFITWSAVIIGVITLVGAAIGLTNIMLVSVTERTKEIGLIKAIGGKQEDVRNQFLYESIIISLMGAIFGIALGILVGNSFSIFFDASFVLPWRWVILGVFICSLVGLLAGLYPSLRAARLKPIESLRYE